MSNKADYDFYKSIGICVRCHKRVAEPNKVMCFKCADMERIKGKEKRKRNHESEKKRDLDKYYRLKEQGVCTYCKHEKAVPGKTKCKKCLAKIKAKWQAKRCEIDRSERCSYGICYICGKNPILPGKGVCKECYETRTTAIQKCIDSRDEGFNDYWKRENNLFFSNKKMQK